MSQANTIFVGNDFVMPKPRLTVEKRPLNLEPPVPVEAIVEVEVASERSSALASLLDLAHRQSFIIFAALFLLVAASGIEVAGRYIGARYSLNNAAHSITSSHGLAGLNLTVPAAQLNTKLAAITNQPVTLKVGNQTTSIAPATIQSWLKITPSQDKNQDYIHLNSQAMTQSITAAANKYAVAPVDQVTDTENGVSQVIVPGQNGYKLSDPSTLATQTASAAKNVMNGAGLNFSTPLVTQSYQAVTTATFDKVILADLTTNHVYFKQNGQLVNTFLSSDGKPSTPTPVGEFKIWAKLTKQTMIGPGYVQPNVPYVNYFDHSGDAVHGVYWRPASVFGNTSTSHGCVGLPVSDPITGANDAEWAYNWAPIGTTVITYHS